MSTYKVIQDIEAEDHILGPLSLRQFIYGLVAAFFLYLSFIFFTKHVPFLLVITLPPALFAGFFAFPFGKDQPTEVWALAKIRFLFKPRKRLWDQSGIKELVTITVPKKIERVLTDGLNQDQVNSRLQALANTIDSRGWAVKNVNVNVYSQPDATMQSSDRLLSPSMIPQAVPLDDVKAADDILDERSNPIAQQFESLITASSQQHRQHLIDQMNSSNQQQTPAVPVAPMTDPQTAPLQANDYWFMNQPAPGQAVQLPADQAVFSGSTTVQPGTAAPITNMPITADESALVERIKAQDSAEQVAYSHLRTIQPLTQQAMQPLPVVANTVTATTTPQPAMTPHQDAAILSLAHNDDLNIATLAREAQKAKESDELAADEVVISLR
jgi:hypothetical protein